MSSSRLLNIKIATNELLGLDYNTYCVFMKKSAFKRTVERETLLTLSNVRNIMGIYNLKVSVVTSKSGTSNYRISGDKDKIRRMVRDRFTKHYEEDEIEKHLDTVMTKGLKYCEPDEY